MRTEQTLPMLVAQTGAPGTPGTSRVLRNTCGLLSATLFFSVAAPAGEPGTSSIKSRPKRRSSQRDRRWAVRAFLARSTPKRATRPIAPPMRLGGSAVIAS